MTEEQEGNMALTRKMLKAMSIEDEKIDQIIEAHAETVNSLKEDLDKYKEDAEKLPGVQKQLDDALEEAKNSNSDVWEAKYNALKEDFDTYKNDITAKETKAEKDSAYRALLKEIGISDKRIDSVLRVSKVDDVELDKDGKIKDADTLKESLKNEWADFIQTTSTQGASTATPPASNGGTILTKEEIYATDEHGRYKLSASERQEALRSLK